jgi:threonine/homoserine/homoserine lactone efflux protein
MNMFGAPSMMEKATGIVLIGFGLKLALERQH